MKLRLIRDTFTEKSTIGKLYVNGFYSSETLEDKDRQLESGGLKRQNETCIPRGTYEVIIDFSNRFKVRMPLLLGVPQFTGVRIHPGNTDKDTEGCILVGKTRGVDFVGDSRLAYDALFANIDAALLNGEKVEIEIT